MQAPDVLHARPHWWVATLPYDAFADHATGVLILPLSAEEPLDFTERALQPQQWTRTGVMTPIFETRLDAEQWVHTFREHNVERPLPWEKYAALKMTPRQIEDGLLRRRRMQTPPPSYHIIPVPVAHEIAAEFFEIYHGGFANRMSRPARGDLPAQIFALEHMDTPPNPEIV